MLSDYWVQRVTRASVGHTALPAITSLFFAPCSAAPVRSATGATIPELVYTGYQRVQIDGSDWEDVEGSPRELVNSLEIPLRPNLGATPVTMIGFALCDDQDVGQGNMLFSGLSVGFVLDPSDPAPRIPPGALHIQI